MEWYHIHEIVRIHSLRPPIALRSESLFHVLSANAMYSVIQFQVCRIYLVRRSLRVTFETTSRASPAPKMLARPK